MKLNIVVSLAILAVVSTVATSIVYDKGYVAGATATTKLEATEKAQYELRLNSIALVLMDIDQEMFRQGTNNTHSIGHTSLNGFAVDKEFSIVLHDKTGKSQFPFIRYVIDERGAAAERHRNYWGEDKVLVADWLIQGRDDYENRLAAIIRRQ